MVGCNLPYYDDEGNLFIPDGVTVGEVVINGKSWITVFGRRVDDNQPELELKEKKNSNDCYGMHFLFVVALILIFLLLFFTQ